MVEYQEHHLGGGGCLIPEAMVGMVAVRTDPVQAAFDEGDRHPASLVLRQEAVSATGKKPFHVFGISSSSWCWLWNSGVPNRIYDGRRKLNLLRLLGV